jgi:hypothetical protein
MSGRKKHLMITLLLLLPSREERYYTIPINGEEQIPHFSVIRIIT